MTTTESKSVSGSARYRAYQEGLFRASGETHKWMYDTFNMTRLLEGVGLVDVRSMGPLFIEARRPKAG